MNLKKRLGLDTIPKKYYDSVATDYDNDYGNIYTETSDLAYEQITKNLAIDNPKVLDIAAGTGNILSKLQETYPKASFTANDASKNMLAITQEKIGNDHKFINGCLKNISKEITPGSQDLVLAHYVMCFVDPEWTILKSLEMLKPGGFLSILTTTKTNLHELRTKHFITTSKLLGANSSIEKAHTPESIDHLTKKIIPDTNNIVSSLLYNKVIKFNNDKDIRSYFIDSGWAGSYMNNGFKIKQALINMMSSSIYETNKNKFPISATSDIAIVLVQKQ